MSKAFFDTNILLYSGDSQNPSKQNKAREILKESDHQGNGVISTQVLQEYYVIEVKKFKRDPLLIKQSLKIWQRFEVVTITPSMIEDAVDISLVYQVSFWDSLIITAALLAKCNELITEDLQHGQIIRGLKIINPFSLLI
ncbi:MAG TPA: PIN domain-containing protein [Chthoniobacterales bacterium]|nr:PIN domain-containing protein [Chthoniobacterales bacterium]